MTTLMTRPTQHRQFTIDDLGRMVEAGILGHDERVELIDGEIVAMSAKGDRHEGIKVALNVLWGRVCPPDAVFAPETALRLDPMNYLEPDFIVFARTTRLADVKGPDVLLAVEVADSSLDYDLRRKPLVYAAFGVRELWVIDAARRTVHVHHSAGPDGYADIRQCGPDARLRPGHAPDAFTFNLDDLEEL